MQLSLIGPLGSSVVGSWGGWLDVSFRVWPIQSWVVVQTSGGTIGGSKGNGGRSVELVFLGCIQGWCTDASFQVWPIQSWVSAQTSSGTIGGAKGKGGREAVLAFLGCLREWLVQC